jgi:hypothetical protein
MRSIGHPRIDFDPPVHGSWMENQQITRHLFQTLDRDPENPIVLSQRGYVTATHPFQLKTQDIQYVGPLDGLFYPVEHVNTELIDAPRQQALRTAHRDLGTELEQTPNVAAGHPTVKDVAAYADLELTYVTAMVSDREEIQQSLSGMLVLAVTSVDDV